MRESDAVGVGLVGCGNIGDRAHAAAYAAIPGVQVVAVTDVDRSRAVATASRSGANVMAFEEMLGSASVDIVDITLPTAAHASFAIAALETGKHVICEKPMAVSVAEADAMVAAAAATDLKLMVGHLRRFDNRFAEVKSALTAGEIGVPRYVRRAERQWLPFGIDAWHWQPGLGGGVVLDIGVHETDLLRWLFGQDPVSVYARGRTIRPEAKEAASPDFVVASFQFPDGAIGDLEMSWAHPPLFSTLFGWLDVVGTTGKLQLNDYDGAPMLRVGHRDGVSLPAYSPFASTYPEAFTAELGHFVDCVVNDLTPAISPADARAALAMAEAIAASVSRGEVVAMEEFGL